MAATRQRIKTTGLAAVAAVYVVAGLAGWAVVAAIDTHPIAELFYADLLATAVVFAGSMVFRNSSVYDPYWSVAPPFIAAAWLSAGGEVTRQTIVMLLLLVWAVRLTWNWASGWAGLAHEDWRYVQIRDQTRGSLPWWLVTFTGIHLMPTLVVFVALLSAWPALHGDRPLNLLDGLGVIVMASAIVVEALADRQLRRFSADRTHAGQTVNIGLWRYSRHPNYLGEISVWWGLWLFGLAADPSWWWTIAGPLAMVALFVGVSIPLMEKRSLARRADYAEYQRRVPMLLPFR